MGWWRFLKSLQLSNSLDSFSFGLTIKKKKTVIVNGDSEFQSGFSAIAVDYKQKFSLGLLYFPFKRG